MVIKPRKITKSLNNLRVCVCVFFNIQIMGIGYLFFNIIKLLGVFFVGICVFFRRTSRLFCCVFCWEVCRVTLNLKFHVIICGRRPPFQRRPGGQCRWLVLRLLVPRFEGGQHFLKHAAGSGGDRRQGRRHVAAAAVAPQRGSFNFKKTNVDQNTRGNKKTKPNHFSKRKNKKKCPTKSLI